MSIEWAGDKVLTGLAFLTGHEHSHSLWVCPGPLCTWENGAVWKGDHELAGVILYPDEC